MSQTTHRKGTDAKYQKAYDSLRVERHTKQRLERLQERIRVAEGLHKRPVVSEVIDRLIAAFDDLPTPPPVEILAPTLLPENLYWHSLLEVILQGENQSMKEAIIKNVRAFAFTSAVAGAQSEKQIDATLGALIRNLPERPEPEAAEKTSKRARKKNPA